MAELIYILGIAALTFGLAKPIFRRFSLESDFLRRRNVWFVLTITAFLAPNFWVFVVIAVPLFTWAGRKDSNPIALYLLLMHVVPPVQVAIPVPSSIVGINQIFNLDSYRLLSLCILVPAAWGLRRPNSGSSTRRVNSMDFLLLAYGAIQVAFFVRPDTPDAAYLHDSATNVLRRAVLFFIDIYVVYFVVSRTRWTRHALLEVLAAFCLACVLMASLAVFEGLRHWLLYAELSRNWGGGLSYLERSGVLRAAVSTGHPLALGYLLAIGLGFWLYLRTHIDSMWSRVVCTLLIWLGLLAAYSRGPWIGALLIYVVFVALGPRATPRLIKASALVALVAAVVLVSPLGDRVTQVIPLMGGRVDVASVEYRQRLARRSLELIREHPAFGDQDVYSKVQDLRQGEGIVDFINTYVEVAVFYGLIGLSLFVGFILVGMVKSYRIARMLRESDPDLSALGVALVACIIGTLLMISACSFVLGYAKMFYVLGGLAVAYTHESARWVQSTAERVQAQS